MPRATHPSQRKNAGSKPKRRRSIGLPSWILRACAILIVLWAISLIWAAVARTTEPASNSSRRSFDAIIVLGTPADDDGNPTPQMLDRVSEGVREYQRGLAPRMILTGSAAHNHYVEAEVMAHVAQAQGVPASAIFQEKQALDTIRNACYSQRILEAHGWRSAEVVSSAAHLPRAAMIFSRLPIEWKTHPAPDSPSTSPLIAATTLVEVLKTARYLVWSRWTERCAA